MLPLFLQRAQGLDQMTKIRVIRILEYIGDQAWIDGTMANNAVQIGKPFTTNSKCIIRELSREYSEPLTPLPALDDTEPERQQAIREAELDDELPF